MPVDMPVNASRKISLNVPIDIEMPMHMSILCMSLNLSVRVANDHSNGHTTHTNRKC